jgi:glucose-1-phosphate adenylyltransferase
MEMPNVLAVILAGGAGSRLSVLSEKRAKPSVPFGGKFRIIDFCLSNCVNSGIEHIAVLTQYRPRSLQEHIGIGKAWDLDRRRGGIELLQPQLMTEGGGWYRGTADAIFQNRRYIATRDFDRILILSGDHIYKMDYRLFYEFARTKNADVAIATMPVSLDEVSRFGIVYTDAEDRITGFEEKPQRADSRLASMGIYLFKKDLLLDAVVENAQSEGTSHDFGRDIIPMLLARGAKLYAYNYTGYWRDVGTLQSYWEANMDTLGAEPKLNLFDRGWPIQTASMGPPPVKFGRRASVANSLVCAGCIINGRVVNSVLFPGTIIHQNAVVISSIIMNDCLISSNCILERVIMDKRVITGQGVRIGLGEEDLPNQEFPHILNSGLTVIGKNTFIPDKMIIGRNCLVGADITGEDFPLESIVKSGHNVIKRTKASGAV